MIRGASELVELLTERTRRLSASAEDDLGLQIDVSRALAGHPRFREVSAKRRGDVLVVEAEWTARDGTFAGLNADVYALIGRFAEGFCAVDRELEPAAIVYRLALGGADHLHTVELRLTGQRIGRLVDAYQEC